jgi:hypothetical protein
VFYARHGSGAGADWVKHFIFDTAGLTDDVFQNRIEQVWCAFQMFNELKRGLISAPHETLHEKQIQYFQHL